MKAVYIWIALRVIWALANFVWMFSFGEWLIAPRHLDPDYVFHFTDGTGFMMLIWGTIYGEPLIISFQVSALLIPFRFAKIMGSVFQLILIWFCYYFLRTNWSEGNTFGVWVCSFGLVLNIWMILLLIVCPPISCKVAEQTPTDGQ